MQSTPMTISSAVCFWHSSSQLRHCNSLQATSSNFQQLHRCMPTCDSSTANQGNSSSTRAFHGPHCKSLLSSFAADQRHQPLHGLQTQWHLMLDTQNMNATRTDARRTALNMPVVGVFTPCKRTCILPRIMVPWSTNDKTSCNHIRLQKMRIHWEACRILARGRSASNLHASL